MSVSVVLPDGSVKEYSDATALKVAADISPRLASAALAAEVNGKLVDIAAALPAGRCEVKIITDRDPRALEILRHSAAHIMAQAVRRLFGAEAKYTIGPALVDDFQYGFYYDFDLPATIAQEDLAKIEAEMKKIIAENIPVERVEMGVEQAKKQMADLGQNYKVEMIDDLVAQQKVTSVSFYRQGDFLDMCRGPHLPSTGKLKAFKLLNSAGAYWRGDEKNKMLTRIYGVAFFDSKSLDEHLARIEEAKKRDHRVIGRQLGLFLISEEVGQGLPMWMPKGAIIRRELENWLKGELTKRGYLPVYTPHISKLDLFRTSGHYPYYKDSQFPPIVMSEHEGYLLKPMNCPFHIQIYKNSQRSYRELPMRLSEFGQVYRMEQSGELGGLVRVRGFTQDDAHIFCTPEQLEAEVESCVSLVQLVLGTLGLNDYGVRVSLRDPASDKYVGSDANWNLAEENLRHVVRKLGLNYVEAAGEAAFYGPKIDFVIKDCIGRSWQLGTIQVDYNLPERFKLEYIGADNHPHQPVMIHRAPFGSLERFMGILIEHFAGAFPMWLSPVQIAVLPVSDKFNEYANKLAVALRDAGVRVEVDQSPDKIGSKIRAATMEKIPYMAVIGQRETESGGVAVRHRTEGDLGVLPIAEFVSSVKDEIDSKGASTILAKMKK